MDEIKSADLKGVYDLHVHASPGIFERWGAAEETARICQAAGMAGIALKAHHGGTTELAVHLNAQFEMNIFGGVVLNYFVGGLNPYAVDVCRALGGKFVWLPTIHAAAHEPLGSFAFQTPKTVLMPDRGIRITEGNDLVEPMYEILEVLNNRNVVLATGHVSANEIRTLVRVINAQRYTIRLLVNHVLFYSPALTEGDVEDLKSESVWFEVSQLTRKIEAASLEQVTRIIQRHEDAQWIMVSDSGQKSNKAPEALITFRTELMQQGISERLIDRMMIAAPKELTA